VGQATLEDVEIRVSAKFPEPLIGAEALQQSVVLIDQRSKTVAVCRCIICLATRRNGALPGKD